MTAKEYLRQYIRATYEIAARLENIEQIMAMATQVTACIDGDRVQSGVSDKVGRAAVALAEMREDIVNKVADLRETKQNVIDTINSVDDERYRLVLYHRYILNKKWENIAVDLNFNYRWVLRLHGQALQIVNADMCDKIN